MVLPYGLGRELFTLPRSDFTRQLVNTFKYFVLSLWDDQFFSCKNI